MKRYYVLIILGFVTITCLQIISCNQDNNEYTKACILIAKGYKKPDGTRYTDQEAEAEILSAEAYKEAINKIINIEGLTIELCGSYIWVTPLDDSKFWDFWPVMKEAGYFFAKVKKQF